MAAEDLVQRLESVLGRMGQDPAPKTANQRLAAAISRLESLVEQGPRVASAAQGPPRLELESWGAKENRKWVVEYQVGQKELVIDNPTSKQTVYVLGCLDSVLHIKGKIRALTLDKCTRVSVIFEEAVGICDVLNCTAVEVKFQGSSGGVSIFNTGGCKVVLGVAALETEITTSRSTEVTVVAPGATEEADEVEYHVPDQLVTKFTDSAFVTTPTLD